MPVIEFASPEDAPRNYGLAIAGDILYSTENTLDSISVWRLVNNSMPEPLGRLNATGLDFPATAAIYDKYLCTVNARLASLSVSDAEGNPEFPEEFFVTCIYRSFDE